MTTYDIIQATNAKEAILNGKPLGILGEWNSGNVYIGIERLMRHGLIVDSRQGTRSAYQISDAGREVLKDELAFTYLALLAKTRGNYLQFTLILLGLLIILILFLLFYGSPIV